MQCLDALEPSIQSKQRRERLAQLISPLRRVRPRTPFFLLAAHRIPTLWGLYRGLRRVAPSDEIKWRLRKLFEKTRNLTGTEKTIKCLNQGYKWLDTFQQAARGDIHLQAVLARYSRLIVAKRAKEHWKQVYREELAWQQRLRSKPILTGALLRPSLDNGPLPRLYPQPEHIGGMIAKRKRTRQRRLDRQRTLWSVQSDLQLEAQFEEGLKKELRLKRVPTVFGEKARAEWDRPIREQLSSIDASYKRDIARAKQPIPPSLVQMLAAARAYKVANKTNEKERERRGMILPRTLRRARKGPPAYILCTMTEEEKKIDRIVRSVSEVGYVGMVKRRAGFKLRDPDLWKKEEEAGPDAEKREEKVFEENLRRRVQALDS